MNDAIIAFGSTAVLLLVFAIFCCLMSHAELTNGRNKREQEAHDQRIKRECA